MLTLPRAVTTKLAQLIMVSAVVMGMSHTIARERIFEPLRTRLGGKTTWLGYLVSCPYCVSHALAFLLVPLTGAYAIEVVTPPGWWTGVLRWFLSSILVTVIAAFLRVIFWLVDEQQALARHEKQLVKDQIESPPTSGPRR
jgi:hypothetical protein